MYILLYVCLSVNETYVSNIDSKTIWNVFHIGFENFGKFEIPQLNMKARELKIASSFFQTPFLSEPLLHVDAMKCLSTIEYGDVLSELSKNI